MEIRFKAFVAYETGGQFSVEERLMNVADLPEGDLLVKVAYSSVNYKDVLSSKGNKGVTRKYPHVPGIDAAGTVEFSSAPAFPTGSQVIITGYDLGMNTYGGFSEYIRIPSNWAIMLPEGMQLKHSMYYGTAGFTAALSVRKILDAGIKPSHGNIAVSGATGGVGSIAIAILLKLGYKVTAISSKYNSEFLLKTLGVENVLEREHFLSSVLEKSLAPPAFAAAIDTVGGEILSGLLSSVSYGGIVTCCGMVASSELKASVFPFILRGVTLAGIDSVKTGNALRVEIWNLLKDEWMPNNLSTLASEFPRKELIDKLRLLENGQAVGRYVMVNA